MFSVIACIRDDHDWRLVAAAAFICLVGSLATMQLLSRAQDCDPMQRKLWIGAGTLACGVGIWSTHFIAMLAYRGSMPISYDPGMTIFSVLISVSASALALAIIAGGKNDSSIGLGSLIMVAGIGAMHLSGMHAIVAAADVTHDPTFSVFAIASGAFFVTLAFRSFASLHGRKRIFIAAAIFSGAICTLHFISMSGMTLVPDPLKTISARSMQATTLAVIVLIVATGLILATLAAVFLGSHLTDLRGLANASHEGLLIVHDDVIVDANDRLLQMSAMRLPDVRGCWVGDILTLPSPIEVDRGTRERLLLCRTTAHTLPVEVTESTIVYRGRQCLLLVIRDLTERKRTEQMIAHLAHHDGLTNLPNRSLFDIRLKQALQSAQSKGTAVGVFCLDLDRFKAVNDIFGHAEGDRILGKVAQILAHCADEGETVARLGGDEFAIIQPDKPQPEGARRLADRILAEFAAEMDTARDPTAVGASLGIALYPVDGDSAEQLCNNADTALYRVKHAGRGKACFFDAEMDAAVRMRRQLENDLKHAVVRHQLSVSYQPILDAQNGHVTGYEALMRWNRPGSGTIEPEIFIPIAEESGSIIQLGQWILERACEEASRWPQPLAIAVNMSPVQFMLPNLFEQIEAILSETGLAAHRLELEITEAALLRDRTRVMATLEKLHAIGVRIVMDDFGTGFSSLSTLRAFPFDKIKVDRSFTGLIEHDAAARSIVRAIIGLGHSLNMPVVTEGVETEMQRRIVVEEGCAQVQGLLLGKPDIEPSVKFAALEKFLASRNGTQMRVVRLKHGLSES